jgi:hypothetical protein
VASYVIALFFLVALPLEWPVRAALLALLVIAFGMQWWQLHRWGGQWLMLDGDQWLLQQENGENVEAQCRVIYKSRWLLVLNICATPNRFQWPIWCDAVDGETWRRLHVFAESAIRGDRQPHPGQQN